MENGDWVNGVASEKHLIWHQPNHAKNNISTVRTTIIIDNQIENVKTAESLGIKSILFENLEQLKKELNSIGIEI